MFQFKYFAVVLSIMFAAIRIYGVKTLIFQAFAHVFIGGLGFAALAFYLSNRAYRSEISVCKFCTHVEGNRYLPNKLLPLPTALFFRLFVCLCIVEVLCFAFGKLRVD